MRRQYGVGPGDTGAVARVHLPGAVRLRDESAGLGQGPDVGSGSLGEVQIVVVQGVLGADAAAERAPAAFRAAGPCRAPAVEEGVRHRTPGGAEVDADPGGMDAAGHPECCGHFAQCVVPCRLPGNECGAQYPFRQRVVRGEFLLPVEGRIPGSLAENGPVGPVVDAGVDKGSAADPDTHQCGQPASYP